MRPCARRGCATNARCSPCCCWRAARPCWPWGSEFGHSQGGNNNAYAQDNEISWLDWAARDESLIAWTAKLNRIRRDHPAFRGETFLTGAVRPGGLPPDVVWQNAAGGAVDWSRQTLVMILAEDEARVALVVHRGSTALPVALPPSPGCTWQLLADSAEDREGDVPASFTVAARSVLVLAEIPDKPGTRAPVDSATLDLLARAAGIAPEWWDVAGHRTEVSDDTKRALLATMRLPAASRGEARDSLRQLGDERDRRALPQAVVVRDGETITLSLGIDPDLNRRATWLTIEAEDGKSHRVKFVPEDGTVVPFTGVDGMAAQAWRVALPALPLGRYRVRREDAADQICHLTVAPPRCFLQETRRRFGVSAQLYSLRRQGDQGIGDFTTLAVLSRAAARQGAAVVGINPLHMLFPADRERASPYHPSDRRFLDPIYIDTGSDQKMSGDCVRYSEVWAAKQKALERMFAADAGNAAFAEFVQQGGAVLRNFAIFQAISESRGLGDWQYWPEGLRSPDSAGVAQFARDHEGRVRFHQYLQFVADKQLAAAADCGLEIGLFRDLAVGAAPDGAEAWAHADGLGRGAWVGAPPDPLGPNGQNWHLPPPLPVAMAREGYATFVAFAGRQHAPCRGAAHRPCDGVVAPVLDSRGRAGIRGRLRFLSSGRSDWPGGAGKPARALHGDRRGSWHRAARVSRRDARGRYSQLPRAAAGARGQGVCAGRALSRARHGLCCHA